MEQNEMLEQIQVQLKSVVETKQAAVEELAEVKSQLEALSSLNTKSTDELAQLQTKYNEQITHLTTRIEEQELALAKGQNIMTQETPIVKSADVRAAVKSALPAMIDNNSISLKAALASTDANQAPLFVEGWEADILKRLTDFSPIVKTIGITQITTMRNTKKRVAIDGAGVRPASQNGMDALLLASGTGKHDWLHATEGKFEAMPVVTRESLRDGDFTLNDIVEELQEAFGVTQCHVALYGDNRELKGILAHFGDEKNDKTRVFDKYQALTIPAKFGADPKVTLEFLQKLKRELASGYKSGAYWYMNEETYDLLGALCDDNGRPLMENVIADGFDGRLLSLPAVIDPTMPTLADAGQVAIMFGDLSRAFNLYQVGEMYVKVEEGARTGGNTAMYHALTVGERMNDSFAVKGARVPTKG